MVKTYEDYIDKLCELFPEIKREDIYNVVKFGAKKMFTYITEYHDFAVDYKWPRSSVLISSKNDTGMTFRKQNMKKRKDH